MAALAYISEGGFNYGDIMEMTSVDRRFYLKRLTEYKKAEAAAMKRAGKPKSSGSSGRRGK